MNAWSTDDRFAKSLRYWRKKRGLTQVELGEMIGISGATIARYELGEICIPRRDRIEMLTKALGVSRNDLLCIDVEELALDKVYSILEDLELYYQDKLDFMNTNNTPLDIKVYVSGCIDGVKDAIRRLKE